jgi:four helix bundle protein
VIGTSYKTAFEALFAENVARHAPCHSDRMPTIKSFRDLLVWQKSVDLAVNCHRIAKRFPRDEQPALGYQVRKSSLSIPSNVAEGFSRHSTAFYVQHLWTAHASGAELETQLIVGNRIGIVAEVEAEALIRDAAEVGRMVNGLVASLERGR